MSLKKTLGLAVTVLLYCQFAFNQRPADVVKTDDIVINNRMIEIYNNMASSPEKTKTINFFLENYTFNQVVILFNHHGEKEFFAMNKSAIDAFIAEKRTEEENYLDTPDYRVAQKRKI